MKKLPAICADRSVTSFTPVIVALAPLDDPTSVIPFSTYQVNAPCASLASENVSTFRIVDVEEYVAGSG